MIRLVKVKLVDESGAPLRDVFVHFDISGADEIVYQHFGISEEGYVSKGGREIQFMEGDYHFIVTLVPEDDRLMLGYPSTKAKVEKGKPITVPTSELFSAPSPEFVSNQEELDKLKELYKEKEGELLVHLKGKEEILAGELTSLEVKRAELDEYEENLKGEFEKTWDDKADVKTQRIRLEIERREMDERQQEILEAQKMVAEARERIVVARENVDRRVGLLEEERKKVLVLSSRIGMVSQDREVYLAELKRRIDGANTLAEEAKQEKENFSEVKGHIARGRDHIKEERARLDQQSLHLADLIFTTQKSIEDQVKDLENELRKRRTTLLDARTVLLEGQKRINNERLMLRQGQDQIEDLTRRGEAIIAENIQNYKNLVEEEKAKIKLIKSKLGEGRKKLREEYYLLLRDVQSKFDALEESRHTVKELDLRLEDGTVEVGETLAEMEEALVKGDNGIYLHLLQRLKVKEKEISRERSSVERERRLAEKTRKEMEERLERLEDARALREEYEARLEDLKDDERDLARRERQLERGFRDLEKERERFEKEKQERMDALAQSDAEIEEGFEELERRRDDIRKEESILSAERVEFLKESMYYGCPECGGIVKVKTDKRPIQVRCSSCHRAYNLKKIHTYPCLVCGTEIEVQSATRPIEVQCHNCNSQFRIRKKPPVV